MNKSKSKIIQYSSLFLIFALFTALHFLLKPNAEFSLAVFHLRLSIYAQYILSGIILALGGLVLQTLLANPLAEPYILGVSSGASFGAVIAVFLSLTPILVFRTGFALVGAIFVSLLIWLLSRRQNSGFSIGIALLAGVGFNALFSSLIMLMQSMLRPNDLHASISWLMGNIDAVSGWEVGLLVVGALLLVVFILRYGREMDIYVSGDEMAQAVGVDTDRLKMMGFIVVSVSSAFVVSVIGMIGFIGLIVPHIVRLLFKTNHRRSILPIFLISSSLLILAGMLSRNIVSGTILPVGVITSLIGAPFFIYILVTRYRGR